MAAMPHNHGDINMPVAFDQPRRGPAMVTKPDRPCDLCRRRKVKCFLEPGDTECARCRSSSQPCTFQEQPQKRQRKSSVSANDGNAPATFQPSDPSPSTSVEGQIPVRPESLPVAISTLYTPNSFKSTELRNESEPTTNSTMSPTLNLYDDTTIEHVGPSGDTGADYMPRAKQLEPHESHSHARRSTITQDEHADPVHFKVISFTGREGQGSRSHHDLDSHIDIRGTYHIIQHSGLALVNLYIRIVHPSFPIANPDRVRKWITTIPQKPLNELNSSDLAVFPLVIASMLVAYHWRHFASTPIPEIDLGKLHSYLKLSLARELEMPRLVTIQGLLLRFSLLVRTLDADNMFRVWNGMGTLVTTAQNLGLHRSPERWNVAKWEALLRKRLWWAIFTTEKWLAYSIGRSSLIHEADWTVRPLCSTDFDGVYDLPAQRFTALTQLTCILSEVHTALFTPRTVAYLTADYAATKALAQPFFARLDQWRSQEQATLKMSDGMEDGAEDSADDLHRPAMLQFAFYAVKVALHRACMRCRSVKDPSVRSDAVQTMREIGSWAKRLTSQDILSVWWSSAGLQFLAITNFFLCLVFTSNSDDEFRLLHRILKGWRWQLRMHLQLFPGLVKAALQRMDDLFKEDDKMENMWRAHKARTPAVGNTRPNSPTSSRPNDQTNGNSILDLARLATAANSNGNSNIPTFLDIGSTPSLHFPPSQESQFDFSHSFANIPVTASAGQGYDPLSELFNPQTSNSDHTFNFQPTEPSLGLDTGEFSLEEFMNWGSFDMMGTASSVRGVSDGQDWAC